MGSVVKRYDVVAGRKYDSRGEEKTHWINVGEAAEWDDGGISLRLHAVPTGNWFDGSLKLFERKPKEDGQRGGGPVQNRGERNRTGPQRSAPQDSQPRDEFDDDIPYVSNRGVY